MRAAVLVVDDDEDLVDALAGLLIDEGFGVAIAHNGFEALSLLHGGLTPSAIVLDLDMPLMNGERFRDEVRKETAFERIPLIVVTGSSTSIDGVTTVRKPFSSDDMVAALRHACAARFDPVPPDDAVGGPSADGRR